MTDPISAELRSVTEDDAYAQPFTFVAKCTEAADHIDAQAATIKALVEALERLVIVYSDMENENGDPCPDVIAARAALAAAKEPT